MNLHCIVVRSFRKPTGSEFENEVGANPSNSPLLISPSLVLPYKKERRRRKQDLSGLRSNICDCDASVGVTVCVHMMCVCVCVWDRPEGF